MAATVVKRSVLHLGADSAGIRLKPREFDRADFDEGWRYELIDGVLVVSPPPLEMERDPNEELGHWLRTDQETTEGKVLDCTLPEQMVRTFENRRRADRVIWIGLGRRPRRDDVPAVLVEFVSAGKRDWLRDYVDKREEYRRLGVKEYWIINRFERNMTVFSFHGKKWKKKVVGEKEIYSTPLLPGFEVPLAKLLAKADYWQEPKT